MYGYVLPDKSIIKNEEQVLFHAFYCGLCFAIKKNFNQAARFSINYDATFFAILVSDQLDYSTDFLECRCIGNPIRKKPTIQTNDLLCRIADLNILMAECKAEDNVLDKELLSKPVYRFFKKHGNKAAIREPKMAEVVKRYYTILRDYEKNNESSIDKVADCFASMMKDCARILLEEKANENNLGIIYNVGKFIYLADALDDVCEDHKKKRYNPFLAARKYISRQKFILDNYADLEFYFASTVNRAIESFNCTAFNQSFGLIENIVHYGLRKKVKELFESEKKLKKVRV
ncbi:MAG: DUF5685 family protein [Firmicutes bacterium]|nr:DUF5685 family protein [Bacillota bacterium]